MTFEPWIFLALGVVVWGFLRIVGWEPPRQRSVLPRWYGIVEMVLGLLWAVLEWLIETQRVTAHDASTLVLLVGGGAVLGLMFDLLVRAFRGIRRLAAVKRGGAPPKRNA